MVLALTGRGTVSGSGTGKWDVVDGFGSGELAHSTGTGTSTSAPGPDSALVTTITGRVTC